MSPKWLHKQNRKTADLEAATNTVDMFWEGHKNLAHLPPKIGHYWGFRKEKRKRNIQYICISTQVWKINCSSVLRRIFSKNKEHLDTKILWKIYAPLALKIPLGCLNLRCTLFWLHFERKGTFFKLENQSVLSLGELGFLVYIVQQIY